MHIPLAVFLFLSAILYSSEAYFITVDAHAEECFFEKVEFGTKMGLTYEIAEGGFLYIDVRIVRPGGIVIFDGKRESSGKYTFAARVPGVYTYCFSNQMSTMKPKVDMAIGKAPKYGVHQKAEGESANKLEEMIHELSVALASVKHEQEYMLVRDRLHHSINESTNNRVVLWIFFEAFILVAFTAGQVYYLKHFFKVKKVV